MSDSRSAKFVRGLVKAVFIGSYIAFMAATVHHVATFFNNFEAGQDTLGSYALAGAFDLTALVTTIGVMFFRKSMPRYVQVILWLFIIAIAGYSFVINWEYASHYQDAAFAMQPTGATTPVFDQAGNLHYVPVMRENTDLLIINPLLGSGFTIFSLVYAVVAEFFGAKPPTKDELQQRKDYLESTADLIKDIRELEQKSSGKSLAEKVKESVKSGKEILQEVAKKAPEKPQEIQQQNTQNPAPVSPQISIEVEKQTVPYSEELSSQIANRFNPFSAQNTGKQPQQNFAHISTQEEPVTSPVQEIDTGEQESIFVQTENTDLNRHYTPVEPLEPALQQPRITGELAPSWEEQNFSSSEQDASRFNGSGSTPVQDDYLTMLCNHPAVVKDIPDGRKRRAAARAALLNETIKPRGGKITEASIKFWLRSIKYENAS